MKHLIMDTAGGKGEGDKSSGGGASDSAALVKTMQDSFKALQADLSKLSNKVDAVQKEKAKPAPQQNVEKDEDLSTLILMDPAKAVDKITEKVRKEVSASVSAQSNAKSAFESKYLELNSSYPEIGDTNSELHIRAKEILASITEDPYDASALERAVYRAAAEKGVTPMKHRKKDEASDEDNEYLGSGSSGDRGNRQGNRRSRNDKLPAATLAFAEAVGMNVKDPKVVERLTARHKERQGTWGRFK